MILAIDVDYSEDTGFVAGISFETWNQDNPNDIFTYQVTPIEKYEPGYFYKRELPCIIKLLENYKLQPELIVIDGYVFLDGKIEPGLGKHLFDSLNGKTPVIGVAKKAFKNISPEFSIYRGASKNPLYVTSVGIDPQKAINLVSNMAGNHRIPKLLKLADQECRKRC